MRNFQSKIIISLVVFLVFINSCSNVDEKIEVTQLNVMQLPEPSEVFKITEDARFYHSFIVDSLLVLTATTRGDNVIYVYNKKDIQLIKQFGTRGLGPFDLLNVIPLTSIQRSNNLYYYDSQIWQLKTINLEKILLGESIADCISSSPLNDKLIESQPLIILDDSRFTGVPPSGKKAWFYIYDSKMDEMKWIKGHPFVTKNTVLNKGTLNANVQKKSIVHAMSYFDKVNFYDLDGKLKKQHIFSPLKMPSLNADNSLIIGESLFYASSICASSDYCFVFRHGRAIRVGRASDVYSHIQLLVFNWDGLLLNTFEIPIREAKCCFDDELGYLYTFQDSEEVYDIYITVRKYDLSEFLKGD